MGSLLARTVLADAQVITQNTADYTDSMDFSRCAGDATVFIQTLLGTVTISQQCSYDNTNWYDPKSNAGAALGVVCTAVAATTGTYIVYTPVLAPYVRFVVTETDVAELTITLQLIFREDS